MKVYQTQREQRAAEERERLRAEFEASRARQQRKVTVFFDGTPEVREALRQLALHHAGRRAEVVHEVT